MSHGGSPTKNAVTRVIQALALVVVFGLLYWATRFRPDLEPRLEQVAAIGFLLLGGTLLSELLEPFGLPHLSGYLLAGIIGGPHLLGLVDHHTVEQLSPINTLALALIALSGGAELRMQTLRAVARSVAWALSIQSVVVLLLVAAAFYLLAPRIEFASKLEPLPLVGLALLWGTLAISRSPSACLGILSQTRARGPVATFSLAFIMASDVVVVVIMAVVMTFVRPLVSATGGISLSDFQVVGHEILGSVSTGTTLGLILAAYLKLSGKNLLLVLLALGFGMTEFMRYVHVDPLLSFLTAGFVVQNLSAQGERLLDGVEQMGSIVYVVFFATAGAHLDLELLKHSWQIALSLCLIRVGATYVASRMSSAIANDPPTLRRWGFSSLVSQAGFALGLSVIIARAFPEFGEHFRSLAIATVAINEMVGPILFKFALDRAGETHPEAVVPRPSLVPPPA